MAKRAGSFVDPEGWSAHPRCAPEKLGHLVHPCGCTRFRLTVRETEVLELVAAGATTAEVARRLFVSEQAVTYHIANLLSKFQGANRTELVARAFVLGVLDGAWPPRVIGAQARGGSEPFRPCASVKDSRRRRTCRPV